MTDVEMAEQQKNYTKAINKVYKPTGVKLLKE